MGALDKAPFPFITQSRKTWSLSTDKCLINFAHSLLYPRKFLPFFRKNLFILFYLFFCCFFCVRKNQIFIEIRTKHRASHESFAKSFYELKKDTLGSKQEMRIMSHELFIKNIQIVWNIYFYIEFISFQIQYRGLSFGTSSSVIKLNLRYIKSINFKNLIPYHKMLYTMSLWNNRISRRIFDNFETISHVNFLPYCFN